MSTTMMVVSVVVIFLLATAFSYKEGWRPRKSFYDSGLQCNDFCAKIKNEKICTDFNNKDNIKCINKKGMKVSPKCYLHQTGNCMSMM